MEKVLVVSSSKKVSSMICELLNEESSHSPVCAETSVEASRMAGEKEYELIIINSPLGNELGDEIAKSLAKSSTAQIMLIVNENIEEKMQNRVEGCGIFVLKKPISRILFVQILKLAGTVAQRLEKLKNENKVLKANIDEIRLVDRAKCVLIQCLKFDEKQAHRYIEKQAMDLRRTKKEVAQNILNTYET
ncbi:MAG: ANTAR domain-containing protein [Oscillospiraceae bacterium]